MSIFDKKIFMETRKCTKCGIEKFTTEFFKDSQKSSGLRPDCKDCNKKMTAAYNRKNRDAANFRNMKYKTGISKKKYFEILNKQDGKCAICGTVESNKRLLIDHCHSSMLVRGLLCNKCNQGIGYFNDNIELLKSAIDYLESNLSIENIKFVKR